MLVFKERNQRSALEMLQVLSRCYPRWSIHVLPRSTHALEAWGPCSTHVLTMFYSCTRGMGHTSLADCHSCAHQVRLHGSALLSIRERRDEGSSTHVVFSWDLGLHSSNRCTNLEVARIVGGTLARCPRSQASVLGNLAFLSACRTNGIYSQI